MNGKLYRDKMLKINPDYYKDIRKKRTTYKVATFNDPEKASKASRVRWDKEKSKDVPDVL